MDETRICDSCGADLAGPFRPGIDLTHTPQAGGEEDGEVTVAARAWICPGCGLVHWYVDDGDLGQIPVTESAQEKAAPRAGESYERRAQMLRMLRRVRRM
jgi:Zn-finger nucleic acid-binding protein